MINNLIVLTGAGISAESGIHTYRDDESGLWKKYDADVVASIKGFTGNPKLCWKFYWELIDELQNKQPNNAHIQLAKLEKVLGDKMWIITQNIDGLHQKAGSKNVIEVHGTMSRFRCPKCGCTYTVEELKKVEKIVNDIPRCNRCDSMLRPDVVMFGENPFYMNKIQNLLHKDLYNYDKKDGENLYIQIGTSGVVYPVAGFTQTAFDNRFLTIGIGLEEPDNIGFLKKFYKGSATEMIDQLIKDYLSDEIKEYKERAEASQILKRINGEAKEVENDWNNMRRY